MEGGVRALGLAALGVGLAVASAALADPLTPLGYMKAMKTAPADAQVTYGPAPQQHVDLFLPKGGSGPFPVVVLVHGGCYSNEVPAASLSAPAAELASRGVAVWNVEYRRVGDPGGGYPGMYQDVGAAIDKLRDEAAARKLDLNRVVIVGHSSGTVLGLWAAGRAHLPATSPLHTGNPLKPAGVVGIAGLGHLKDIAPQLPWICGDDLKADQVVGQAAPTRPDPFADTSPQFLLPFGMPQLMITGVYDSYLPPYMALWWRIAATRKGDPAEVRVIPDAGHFDVVAVQTPAWPVVRDAILEQVAKLKGQ